MKILILIIAALLLISCASSQPNGAAAFAALPVREIPADYAGLAHGGTTRTQQEFDYMEYLGINWILHTFSWNRVEVEPGEWDFQYFDEIVDMAVDTGIKTLGILAYGNRYLIEGNESTFYIRPDHVPYFLRYVRRTVEHFRGRVDAWCIWNEPNTPFWKGSDKEFFELTRRTAEVIREVDSDVIIMGGAFNRGFFGLPKKYIRGLFESGAMENVDVVAFHPYEINPARAARLFDKFKKEVEPYGFGDKIWITEMGYPTGGRYPTRIPERKKSEYLVKTWTLLAIRENHSLLWYQLFDPEVRQTSNSEDFFGIVRSSEDYSSKAAEALRLCAVYLSGTIYNTLDVQREELPQSLVSYYFIGHDTSTLILWNNNPGSVNVRLQLPGNNHQTFDLDNSAATAIQANSIIKVNSRPVFITWQSDGAHPVLSKN